MGPDCRRRLLADVDVSEDVRKQANQIVYAIAVMQKGFQVGVLTDQLRRLGFQRVAERIDKRVQQNLTIIIEQIEDQLYIQSPYDAQSISDWRRIPGRRFARTIENGRSIYRNIMPVSMKHIVWDLLKKYYPGQLGQGPKGRFIVDIEEEK